MYFIVFSEKYFRKHMYFWMYFSDYLYFYNFTHVFSDVFLGKNNKIHSTKIDTIKINCILLDLQYAKEHYKKLRIRDFKLHYQILSCIFSKSDPTQVVLTKRNRTRNHIYRKFAINFCYTFLQNQTYMKTNDNSKNKSSDILRPHIRHQNSANYNF